MAAEKTGQSGFDPQRFVKGMVEKGMPEGQAECIADALVRIEMIRNGSVAGGPGKKQK